MLETLGNSSIDVGALSGYLCETDQQIRTTDRAKREMADAKTDISIWRSKMCDWRGICACAVHLADNRNTCVRQRDELLAQDIASRWSDANDQVGAFGNTSASSLDRSFLSRTLVGDRYLCMSTAGL
jgi:hypothetical protein